MSLPPARSRRRVGHRELRLAAARLLQLDQDLAEALLGSGLSRLRGAGRHEEHLPRCTGARCGRCLRPRRRRASPREHITGREIVAVAIGALTWRKIHLPDANELVLEQSLLATLPSGRSSRAMRPPGGLPPHCTTRGHGKRAIASRGARGRVASAIAVAGEPGQREDPAGAASAPATLGQAADRQLRAVNRWWACSLERMPTPLGSLGAMIQPLLLAGFVRQALMLEVTSIVGRSAYPRAFRVPARVARSRRSRRSLRPAEAPKLAWSTLPSQSISTSSRCRYSRRRPRRR